jgi:hypothetical protein
MLPLPKNASGKIYLLDFYEAHLSLQVSNYSSCCTTGFEWLRFGFERVQADDYDQQ